MPSVAFRNLFQSSLAFFTVVVTCKYYNCFKTDKVPFATNVGKDSLETVSFRKNRTSKGNTTRSKKQKKQATQNEQICIPNFTFILRISEQTNTWSGSKVKRYIATRRCVLPTVNTVSSQNLPGQLLVAMQLLAVSLLETCFAETLTKKHLKNT